MALIEMHLQHLITEAPVRTGCLLSEGQSNDLRKSHGVKDEHIKARTDGTLGLVKKELSGVRGYPFLITHLDEFGRKTVVQVGPFRPRVFSDRSDARPVHSTIPTLTPFSVGFFICAYDA